MPLEQQQQSNGIKEAARRGSSDSSQSKASRDSIRNAISKTANHVMDKKVSSTLELVGAEATATKTPQEDATLTKEAGDAAVVCNGNAKKATAPAAESEKSSSIPPNSNGKAAMNGERTSRRGVDVAKHSKDLETSRSPGQGRPASPTIVGAATTPTDLPNKIPTSTSPASMSANDNSQESTPSDRSSTPLVEKGSKESLKPVKKSKVKHEPQLYGHLPDATEEAISTFDVIDECIYSSKTIGDSGHDSELMHCECEPEFVDGENHACGEDSDCINRMTLMECTNDGCGCHSECGNQRFQKRDYADVSIFKTEKKGYGVRANSDIPAGRFIYEYVGEVIDENRFRQRNVKYPSMGIKHFYFMSLEKDQFIDATMKGGLARFVNHSCNPNSETEKWIVGNKFRMGIFAKRDIKAGEEIVFDYNVDRYGAEKQPCYCGEPNCLGYIGGKTQTNDAPKLSGNLQQALGIDDDEMPAKKSRRARKTGENDEDYLAKAGSKALDLGSVKSVMGTLSNTKERWIVSKLVNRIQKCDDEAVLGRVLQLHGYTIIGKFLTLYKDDEDIVSTILSIFISFPKLTRNKINAAGIEPVVADFISSTSDEIKSKANELLKMWSTLETSYRIPRRLAGEKEEPSSNSVFLERGRGSRSTSQTESPKQSPTRNSEPIPPWLAKQKIYFSNSKPSQIQIQNQIQNQTFVKQPPSGPRADRERFGNRPPNPRPKFTSRPQFGGPNNPNMIQATPKQPKPQLAGLPRGWHKCYQYNECYYYANDGRVSWDMPTQPCSTPGPPMTIPPPPPKPGDLDIQTLIQEAAAEAEENRRKKEEEEKERERQERRAKRKEKEASKVFDHERTRKYLSIAFGKHVPNMVNKYKKDMGSTPTSAKENVKKYSKDIVKLLVDKEMRYHKTVVDPINVCDEAKIAKVKAFVDDYVKKLIERRKAAKAQQKLADGAAKRKRDGVEASEEETKDDTKRMKSASPASAEDGATATTLVVPPSSPGLSSTPTKKRGHEEDDTAGSVSPKRRRSLDDAVVNGEI